MKVGITGAHGLIGWHLRCFLHGQSDVQVVPLGRHDFHNPERLDSATRSCDVIVHLACMNRGREDDVTSTNMMLVETLVESLIRTGGVPQVIFSSSTQVDTGTPYGDSKQEVSGKIASWAEASGAVYSNVILPHVFGELGKPFHNSVVSTFCYQLAHDETPNVESDLLLNLLHAQDVAELVYGLVGAPASVEIRPQGMPITVSGLLESISELALQYEQNTIPDLADHLTHCLFNTYRSYLFPKTFPRNLELHKDERGFLFEAIKGHSGGQTFLSTTRPGVTRGNHFHLRKVERFLVVEGDAVIRIKRMYDDQVHTFEVCGKVPQYIDMPTLHTHNITNVGDGDLLTMFWANEIFDPNHPDTFSEPVGVIDEKH